MNAPAKNGSESEPPLIDKIPVELEPRIRVFLSDTEEIKVAVSTDLLENGNYGQDWIIATTSQLVTARLNGTPDHDLHVIPLEDIETVDIHPLHGNNVMKIRTHDSGIEVARYSKTAAEKFFNAKLEIDFLIRQSQPKDSDKSEERKHLKSPHIGRKKAKCDQCGRAIPHWTDVCTYCIEKRKLIFRLLAYALPHWKISLGAFLIMVFVRAVSVYPGILNKRLFDEVLAPPTGVESSGFSGLVTIVLMMIGVNIFTTSFSTIRSYVMSIVGQRVKHQLRTEAYQHLNRLSISFYQKRDTGNIMSRLTHDVGRLEDFIAYGLQDMVGDILMLVFMFSVMTYYNWQLTLLSMIPIPLIIIFTVYFGTKVRKIYHIVWKQISGVSTILASVIPGVRVVKAFGREGYETDRFDKQSERVLETGLRSARWESVYGPTMGFITFSGSIIIWFAGGRQLLNGNLTTGELIMFMGYMMQFMGPIRMLSGLNRRFLQAATSSERVFEILDTPPDIADSRNSVKLEQARGEIEFRNVSFSYDSEQDALNDVSFTVQPGEMIGLAGHSGAGKSTLINLITRFYDPTGGDILLDGHNLGNIQLDSLRDQVGVVLQDPFLFNGTVAENIGYSKLNATSTEIIAAAKAANAHDFIVNFADGYDTRVGERGARVSGGERQRISIARAILKNPRILILDEATSSVDTETESKIQEALERLIRGRTVFAIAHRLSTLKYANRLLILKDGKVDEIGTHEELIAKDGTYASLCRKQTDLSKIRAW
ncbi:hypothetical protein CMK22_03550 [Candidatus Poribacteria bacterium]|nr:hypothetical protein [Candidatus Poribacteria bacterium]